MQILHLRYFVAVAEHLSFSRAARQLHMATSPLSQRVRDLERELGAVLFERDSHTVALTEAGTLLLPIARDALAGFDAVPDRFRAALGTPGTVVAHVGIAPALHPEVRDALRELERRAAPGVDVKRRPGSSRDLVAAVARGELDLALVHLPADAAGVSVCEVRREPLGAVLPAAEFTGRTSVALAELTDHAYVTPPPEMVPTYFDQLEVRLAAAGIHRRVVVNSGEYRSSAEMVANGGGFAISMLDPGSGLARSADAAVVVLPFEGFAPVLVTALIWRTDRAGDLVGTARTVLGVTRPSERDHAARPSVAPTA